MPEQSFDALVVGAGFAGAAAASVLQGAGLRTVVLEARSRAGGRAFTRTFVNSADVLEFGGAWVTPAQHRIRHYARKCDFLLRPTAKIVARRWHDGSVLRRDAPAAPADLQEFELGRKRIVADALVYAKQQDGGRTGPSLLDVSMNVYLQRINAGRALRAQAMAWWCISGNGDPSQISAVEFISSCAHGDGSPEGMMDALQHTLVSGAGDLVRRMIETSGAALRFDAEVVSVQQFRSDVLVSCKNGDAYRAKAAVVAVPLNVLNTIRFAPSLAPPQGAGRGARPRRPVVQVVDQGSRPTDRHAGDRWLEGPAMGICRKAGSRRKCRHCRIRVDGWNARFDFRF